MSSSLQDLIVLSVNEYFGVNFSDSQNRVKVASPQKLYIVLLTAHRAGFLYGILLSDSRKVIMLRNLVDEVCNLDSQH